MTIEGPPYDLVADPESGDELEHGEPDFPGQFPEDELHVPTPEETLLQAVYDLGDRLDSNHTRWAVVQVAEKFGVIIRVHNDFSKPPGQFPDPMTREDPVSREAVVADALAVTYEMAVAWLEQMRERGFEVVPAAASPADGTGVDVGQVIRDLIEAGNDIHCYPEGAVGWDEWYEQTAKAEAALAALEGAPDGKERP
jgi:hypothetical protein